MKSMMMRTSVREIRQSFGRFFAIFAIIALGVGFFSGVRITTPTMINSVNEFLTEKQFFDYRLLSTAGWDEESVEALRQQEDVRYAEGAYSLDLICQVAQESELVLKIHSLPEHINGIRLEDGRLPQKADECVLDARFGEGAEVGNTVVVTQNNEQNTMDMLTEKEFTVVGIADSSYYINFERGTSSIGNGSISGFVYLPAEAFAMEAYSEIFVKFDQDAKIYSQEYRQSMRKKREVWETIANETAAAAGERLMTKGRLAIEEQREQISQAREYGALKLQEMQAELETVTDEALLRQKTEQYEEDVKTYTETLMNAEAALSQAEEKLESMAAPDTYVLGRGTNIGYACFESDAEIVEQVARVFPVFFILVAALVCMTTMSRMVEEQRSQIGIFKALGYSQAAIMKKFLFYSGSAALLGCVSGYGTGILLFPKIIWMCYELMYISMPLRYLFAPKLALVSLLVSVFCSMGTTFAVCRYELSETASQLMRPKAPKPGKRVWLEYVTFLWKKIRFLHKVSIRNIFRYKGRFWMMVVGISGCMALLLTGFGIKDSIAGFAQEQFEEIQVADGSVSFKNDVFSKEEVPEVIGKETADYLLRYQKSWNLLVGEKVKSIDLIAVDDSTKVQEFIDFHTRGGKALAYPFGTEAIISISISERYDLHKGDEIVLQNDDMKELHLQVSGVFENHVYNCIYISPEALAAVSESPVAYNAAYVNFKEDEAAKEVSARISRDEAVASVTDYESLKERLSHMMSSLNYVVIVIIACAAGLAFIVIYNLTNINITERLREIATIKVLGFFRNETSAYVLRENIFLTLIGMLFGMGLGVLLHRFVMKQIVVDMVCFTTTIFPASFVYSVLLTLLFNLFVNLVMERKLEKINMAEALKSVE